MNHGDCQVQYFVWINYGGAANVAAPCTIYTEKFSRCNMDEGQVPVDNGDSAAEGF